MGMEHTHYRLKCQCGNVGTLDEAVHDAYDHGHTYRVTGEFDIHSACRKRMFSSVWAQCKKCGTDDVAWISYSPELEAAAEWRRQNTPHDAHVFAYNEKLASVRGEITNARAVLAESLKRASNIRRSVASRRTRTENAIADIDAKTAQAKRAKSVAASITVERLAMQRNRLSVSLKRHAADCHAASKI